MKIWEVKKSEIRQTKHAPVSFIEIILLKNTFP